MAKISDELQEKIARNIIEDYQVGKQNNDVDDADYEEAIDMFDCIRPKEGEAWESNVFIPEFLSQMLIQSSIAAKVRHSTRDYVNVYLASKDEKHVAAANAEKELLNRTLNQRYLHFYQKDMRAVIIKNLAGVVYFRCWWEQEIEKIRTTEKRLRPLDVDVNGEPLLSEEQIPEIGEFDVTVEEDKVLLDRFNFDVIDPRNVFESNEYTYTLQEKNWIIIRFDTTVDQLEREQAHMGYFNLDKLRKMNEEGQIDGDTETKRETADKSTNRQESETAPIKELMVLEWHGKDWVVVKRDNNGRIKDVSVGIDEDGNVKKKAEYMRVIRSVAVVKGRETLIRYQLSPYKDAKGNRYVPVIRALCYVHPVKDRGLGDGKGSADLQIAINDNFNLGQNRIKLATTPMFKGRFMDLDYNKDNYVVAPNALWEVNDINDITEIQISDNIAGTINQNAMLTNIFQQKNAASSTVQGQLPPASTKATAIVASENRTDTRSNYKDLTYDNTGISELYWMISQMTAQFARPDTYIELLGEDKVLDFNPTLNYTYKVVTEAIETEYSRSTKIQQLIQLYGMTVNVPNPNVPKVLNDIYTKIAKLMGDEVEDVVKGMLDESEKAGQMQMQATGRQQQLPQDGGLQPAQNQFGGAQSQIEQFARGQF